MKANALNPQTDRQTVEVGGERGMGVSPQMCIPSAGVVMEPLNGAGRGMQTERAERRSPKASQMTQGERRGARHVAPRPHAALGLFFLWVKGRAGSPPCLKPSRESRLSCVGGRCDRGILSFHGALHRCLSVERV